MRNMKKWTLTALMMLVALSVAGIWSGKAEAATSRVAIIKELSGTVQVKKAGGSKQFKAFARMSLNEGDVLTTGAKSSATLQFANGTSEDDKMAVAANTTLTFSKLSDRKGTRTKVSMFNGSAWVDVKSIASKNDEFTLETPTAIMGVRGTHLLVSVDPNSGVTKLTVAAGVVNAKTKDAAFEQGEDVLPTENALFTEDSEGNGEITIAPSDLDLLLKQSDKSIIEAIIAASGEIVKENDTKMDAYLEQTGETGADSKERKKSNIENLLGAIVDTALKNGTISQDRVNELVTKAQEQSGVKIDLTKKEIKLSAEEEKVIQAQKAKEAAAQKAAEEAKKKAEEERKKNDALLKKLEEERKKLEEANKKAEQEQKKKAEEELLKKLSDYEKKKFEENKNNNSNGSTGNTTGSTGTSGGSTGGTPQTQLSSNANLSGLTLSDGVSLSFNPDTTSYDVWVKGKASLNVTATVADTGKATLKIGSLAAVSGQSKSIDLAQNSTTTVAIEVTAQNGTTKKTYTIAIYESTLFSSFTLPTGVDFKPEQPNYILPPISSTATTLDFSFGTLEDTIGIQYFINGVSEGSTSGGNPIHIPVSSLASRNNVISFKITGPVSGQNSVASTIPLGLLGVILNEKTYEFQVWNPTNTSETPGNVLGVDVFLGTSTTEFVSATYSNGNWIATVPAGTSEVKFRVYPKIVGNTVSIGTQNTPQYRYGEITGNNSISLNSSAFSFTMKDSSGNNAGTFSVTVNHSLGADLHYLEVRSADGSDLSYPYMMEQNQYIVYVPADKSSIKLAFHPVDPAATIQVTDGSTSNSYASGEFVTFDSLINDSPKTVQFQIIGAIESSGTFDLVLNRLPLEKGDTGKLDFVVSYPGGAQTAPDANQELTVNVPNTTTTYYFNPVVQEDGPAPIFVKVWTDNVSTPIYPTYVADIDQYAFPVGFSGDNKDVHIRVTSFDQSEIKDYTLHLHRSGPLSSAKEITNFGFNNPAVNGTIDSVAHTISVTVPYGTSVSSLVGRFTLSAGATATVGGNLQTSDVTSNDFSTSVVYTVKAEDGTEQQWTVQVHVENHDNSLPAEVASWTIMEGTNSLSIHTLSQQEIYGVNYGEYSVKVGQDTPELKLNMLFTENVSHVWISNNNEEIPDPQNALFTKELAPISISDLPLQLESTMYSDFYIAYQTGSETLHYIHLIVLKGETEAPILEDLGLWYSEGEHLSVTQVGDHTYQAIIGPEADGYSTFHLDPIFSNDASIKVYQHVDGEYVPLPLNSYGSYTLELPTDEDYEVIDGWYDYKIEVWDRSGQAKAADDILLHIWKGREVPTEFANVTFEAQNNPAVGKDQNDASLWYVETDNVSAIPNLLPQIPVGMELVRVTRNGMSLEAGENGYYELASSESGDLTFISVKDASNREFTYRFKVIPHTDIVLNGLTISNSTNYNYLATVGSQGDSTHVYYVPNGLNGVFIKPNVENDNRDIQVIVNGEQLGYKWGGRQNSDEILTAGYPTVEIQVKSPSGYYVRNYTLRLQALPLGMQSFVSEIGEKPIYWAKYDESFEPQNISESYTARIGNVEDDLKLKFEFDSNEVAVTSAFVSLDTIPIDQSLLSNPEVVLQNLEPGEHWIEVNYSYHHGEEEPVYVHLNYQLFIDQLSLFTDSEETVPLNAVSKNSFQAVVSPTTNAVEVRFNNNIEPVNLNSLHSGWNDYPIEIAGSGNIVTSYHVSVWKGPSLSGVTGFTNQEMSVTGQPLDGDSIRWLITVPHATLFMALHFDNMESVHDIQTSEGTSLGCESVEEACEVTLDGDFTVIYVIFEENGHLLYQPVFILRESEQPPEEGLNGLGLSDSTLYDDAGALTTVGYFTPSGSTSSTFTYELVNGTGDTDNASFAISDGYLVTAENFELAKSEYSVRVRVTDGYEDSYEQVFSISVIPLVTYMELDYYENRADIWSTIFQSTRVIKTGTNEYFGSLNANLLSTGTRSEFATNNFVTYVNGSSSPESPDGIGRVGFTLNRGWNTVVYRTYDNRSASHDVKLNLWVDDNYAPSTHTFANVYAENDSEDLVNVSVDSENPFLWHAYVPSGTALVDMAFTMNNPYAHVAKVVLDNSAGEPSDTLAEEAGTMAGGYRIPYEGTARSAFVYVNYEDGTTAVFKIIVCPITA